MRRRHRTAPRVAQEESSSSDPFVAAGMPAIDPSELEQQMRELLRELDPENLLVRFVVTAASVDVRRLRACVAPSIRYPLVNTLKTNNPG